MCRTGESARTWVADKDEATSSSFPTVDRRRCTGFASDSPPQAFKVMDDWQAGAESAEEEEGDAEEGGRAGW